MKTEFEKIEMEQRYGIVAIYGQNFKDVIEEIFPVLKTNISSDNKNGSILNK